MSKKKDTYAWFWNLLLLIGGGVMIMKLFDRLTKTDPGQQGIYGIPHVRKFVGYVRADGKDLFRQDLLKYTNTQRTGFLGLISDMSIDDDMGIHFKPLKGTIVTGELKKDEYRIFVYQETKTRWVALSCFIKKTNETPKNEIEKAENRLREYLGRTDTSKRKH